MIVFASGIWFQTAPVENQEVVFKASEKISVSHQQFAHIKVL